SAILPSSRRSGASRATPWTRERGEDSALQAHGRIFAMLSGEELVVKLPRERVAALLASGAGERLRPWHAGRPMTGGPVVRRACRGTGLPCARQALAFVGQAC